MCNMFPTFNSLHSQSVNIMRMWLHASLARSAGGGSGKTFTGAPAERDRERRRERTSIISNDDDDEAVIKDNITDYVI